MGRQGEGEEEGEEGEEGAWGVGGGHYVWGYFDLWLHGKRNM